MPFTLTGGMVREHRQRLGVTQAELARALGYTRAAISRWERRETASIPRAQYERVLHYLNNYHERIESMRAVVQRLTQ